MSGTAESFNEGFPPIVIETKDRTHCNVCQVPLAPDVMHKCDGNKEWKPPRRIDATQWTPMEKAIHEAKMVVEAGPADTRLTKAVLLLNEAQFEVANFVDGVTQ